MEREQTLLGEALCGPFFHRSCKIIFLGSTSDKTPDRMRGVFKRTREERGFKRNQELHNEEARFVLFHP